MTYRRCIFCNANLDKSNKSSEHIIPKCLGGKLKSDFIVCKKM
ncbi:MAG: HNH endonuclease [Promethearchaeota archaeon]